MAASILSNRQRVYLSVLGEVRQVMCQMDPIAAEIAAPTTGQAMSQCSSEASPKWQYSQGTTSGVVFEPKCVSSFRKVMADSEESCVASEEFSSVKSSCGQNCTQMGLQGESRSSFCKQSLQRGEVLVAKGWSLASWLQIRQCPCATIPRVRLRYLESDSSFRSHLTT